MRIASAAIKPKQMARMAIWVVVMAAPPIMYVRDGMICGKARMLRLQIMSATCCRMIDTPIAVIKGARRGAWRSGR